MPDNGDEEPVVVAICTDAMETPGYAAKYARER
jgi:hypothetical protein